MILLLSAVNSGQVINGPWLPGVLLAQLYVAFFAFLAWSTRQMPDRLTTQFGLLGKPTGHMRRKVYLIFISVFALWLPLFGLIFYVLGRQQPKGFHVPHWDYWFGPEHFEQTQSYLLGHWLWFGCIMVVFMAGLHYLLLRANQQQSARLPWLLFIGLLAYLGLGMTWWTLRLSSHFAHVPSSPTLAI